MLPAMPPGMDQPNILSIVPPLVALTLAIGTRNVLLSLGFGVLLGMIIHAGFNPWIGLLDLFERGVFVQLTDASHAQVLIIILIIGGFVQLIDRSGGMRSFARSMTRVVDSPLKAQLAVWFTGLGIFFTDSGNPLILGPLFRPIFTRLRICREKLAFIIDSTSAPVCILIPFISWGVYVMGLLEQSFGSLGLDREPLGAFLGAIPFQMYPVLALVTVPVMAFTARDWGPMARAQRRHHPVAVEEPPTGDDSRPTPSSRVVLIPLATLLLTLLCLFTVFAIDLGSLPGEKVRLSLALAYLTATAVAAALLRREGIFSWRQSFRAFLDGTGRMVLICAILLLAWSLGDVCELLHTGEYLATAIDGLLRPGLLPAVVFVLAAVFSLATGSSWGTFALLLPIAIPVAHYSGAPLAVTTAAVLSGGIFGDHCSPISDTTVLSSMATGCRHADHVNTQLPYAAVTGGVALLGFVLAGLTGSALALGAALIVQVGLVIGLAQTVGVPAGAVSGPRGPDAAPGPPEGRPGSGP